MASKNQNKPPIPYSAPTSPSIKNQRVVDEGAVDKRRKIGVEKMVGPANGVRNRQAFTVVNGGQENGGPPSSAGSEGGSIEFTKEDVEALLNEKMKGKKYNVKEKMEANMANVKDGLLREIYAWSGCSKIFREERTNT